MTAPEKTQGLRFAVTKWRNVTLYDMRAAHNKWPRSDGGRWLVRYPSANFGCTDEYRRTFWQAVRLMWSKRHATNTRTDAGEGK